MAISETTNLQLPYPEPGSGETNNVPQHLMDLAEKLDAVLVLSFVPKWKAFTTYTVGDPVVAPDGALVVAAATFTSGAAYDSADWDSAPITGLAAVAYSGSASDITIGTLPNSVMPPIAITDSFPVASQAALLALAAEKGDVAIRSDLNRSFILSTNNPGTLGDWLELLTPTDTVLSVAGKVGVVSLGTDDVAGLDTALGLKAPAEAPTFSGTTTIGTADTNVEKLRAAVLETHQRTTTITYNGDGTVATVVEKDGATTVKTTTLTYTGDNLTTIAVVAGGQTATTTLVYTGTDLTSTTRSVV